MSVSRLRTIRNEGDVRLVLLLLPALLLIPLPARANNSDIFGLGARGQGMAGAQTAISRDFGATYYNPAGLAFTKETEVALGFGFTDFDLDFDATLPPGATTNQQFEFDLKNRRAERVDDFPTFSLGAIIPHTFSTGAEDRTNDLGTMEFECYDCGTVVSGTDRNCPDCGAAFRPLRQPPETELVGGDQIRVAFGIGLLLPPRLVQISAINDRDPQFILYEGRGQKLAIYPALAISFNDWLAVGVGASVLADFESEIEPTLRLTGSPEGPSNTNIEADLVADGAPTAGVRVSPYDWLHFGAAYRGELSLKVDVVINTSIEGLVQANLGLEAITLFSPQQLQFGVGLGPFDGLTVALDLTWLDWSAYQGPAARLRLLPGTNIPGAVALPTFQDPDFRDILIPRLGLEYARGGWIARFGYAFRPTPVPRQSGPTNLLDSDKHLVTLGAGVDLDPLAELPVAIETFAQFHLHENRDGEKVSNTLNPPTSDLGGTIINVGLQLTFTF